MNSALITGGSGFVGSHLINYLLENNCYDKIVIADLVKPSWEYSDESTEIAFVECDLRQEVHPDKFTEVGCNEETVIYNLAAICRIPGFPDIDYFRTNIKGAENVCKLAEELGTKYIVFTSSVSPYGKSEELKKEETIPQPEDPYGSSKLVAEYIHKGWQEKDPENRMLTILRPGIIFGKGEQANFTRLYESQRKGFFVYPGRKDTRKACVYVKDVARACYHFSNKEPGQHLFNLVYEKAPTIQEICETVARETDARKPFMLIPGPLLIFAAYVIMVLGKVIGKEFTGIHPDRVKKVMISTNVSGEKLSSSGFKMSYSLSEGVRDWYKDCESVKLC